jgi:hypothetical protein
VISLSESAQNQQQWSAIQRVVDNLLRPTRQQLQPTQAAIRDGFAENFDSESAGGQPWEQLALSTVIERVLLGFPGTHPILQRTGRYRSSFTSVGGEHISDIDYQSGVVSLFEGSRDERVAELELGSGKMPARPVLEMSHHSIDAIGSAINEMINEILNAR